VKIIDSPKASHYDAVVIAVAHRQYKELGANKIRSFGKINSIIYDLKYILSAEESDIRL
jgi:UDP-N-acetyl-D-galactosamine dehydrogenase